MTNMQNLMELWIVAIATATCLFLRRTSITPALRWWLWSWSAAAASLALALVATATDASTGATYTIAVFRALLEFAQLLFVVLGLIQLQPARRRPVYFIAGLGAGLMLLFWVRLFATDTFSIAVVAAHNVGLSIICGVLTSYFARRSRREIESRLSLVILLALIAFQLMNSAVLSRLLDPGAGSLFSTFATWPGWSPTMAAALVLSMVLIALIEVGEQNAAFMSTSHHLRAGVESAPCAICEIDAAGAITTVNRAAAHALARDQKELEGAILHDILEPDSRHAALNAAEYVLRPVAPVVEARGLVHREDGQPAIVEWSVAPLAGAKMPEGGVVIVRDITERAGKERLDEIRGAVLELIARNKSLEQSARALASAVEERLPGSHCSVLVCDGEWFRVVASFLADEYRTALSRLPSCRISSTDNLASFKSWERRFLLLGREHGYSGTWVEPMTSAANEVLGAVVVNDSTQVTLEPDQKRVIELIAKLGAIAVEHRRTVERLTHQGHHDALTGLPNRILLEDRLKQGLARAERGRKKLALLAIDLDRFKYVNDTFGHDAGDLFLQQITVRLSSRIRGSDTLARTGGDEFTAIITDIQDERDAATVAETLTATLAEPFEVDGHTLYGAVSIGVAVYPDDGADPESLRRNADRALYRAKANGRNMIQCYSSGPAREDSNRMDVETQLHRAIEDGNFELRYQPQFTCDQQLIGFEALLRFQHPKLGMVPPSQFIPIAEESGLILPIGQWVMQEACRQIKEWERKGLRPVRVAVNGSPLQFAQREFSQNVEKILESFNVRPELLELEVTEGMLMQNVRDSASQMKALSALGVKLSVDDFGTGYSSLAYLHQLPIHTLKIDRSFVDEMLQVGGTRSIVEAIISIAHSLGLKTIAEGVEDEQQFALLKSIGCDYIQGYYFSRPLTAIQASRLLWERSTNEVAGGIHPLGGVVWTAPRSNAVS